MKTDQILILSVDFLGKFISLKQHELDHGLSRQIKYYCLPDCFFIFYFFWSINLFLFIVSVIPVS